MMQVKGSSEQGAGCVGGQGAELSPVSHYSFVVLRLQESLFLTIQHICSGLPRALPSCGSSQAYAVGSRPAQVGRVCQDLRVSPAQVSLHFAGPKTSGIHTLCLELTEAFGLQSSLQSSNSSASQREKGVGGRSVSFCGRWLMQAGYRQPVSLIL